MHAKRETPLFPYNESGGVPPYISRDKQRKAREQYETFFLPSFIYVGYDTRGNPFLIS